MPRRGKLLFQRRTLPGCGAAPSDMGEKRGITKGQGLKTEKK